MCFVYEAGSCYVMQADLNLGLSECRDYKCVPSSLVSTPLFWLVLRIKLGFMHGRQVLYPPHMSDHIFHYGRSFETFKSFLNKKDLK